MIGIDPDFDYLYDPQQAKPAGWCPICRMEIWTPGKNLCRACEEAQKGENPDWEGEDD